MHRNGLTIPCIHRSFPLIRTRSSRTPSFTRCRTDRQPLPDTIPTLLRAMRRSHVSILLFLTIVYAAFGTPSQAPPGTYENSLILAPLYVEYAEDSPEQFAREADELKLRIPAAPYVKVGFAAFVTPQFPDIPLEKTVTESDMAADLAKIDLLVNRAREHALIN